MTLAAVIVLVVLTHTAFAGARVGAALFALALGASTFEVGVIGALFAALPMFFSVKAGRAIDSIGVRPPFILGTLLTAAGATLAFAWPTVQTLYLVATLAGSGLVIVHIAASNAVGALGVPADRSRNFSLLALGFSISGFLGPLAAGFMIDGLGHPRAFLILAAFPLVAFLALVLGRLRLPRPAAAPHSRAERRIGDLLADRRLRSILVASALFNMAWDVFTFVAPIYGTALGLSASAIGVLLGAFAAATFLVRLVLPALVRRTREWTLVAVALGVACIVYASFPLFRELGVLMTLAFVLGLGLGMSQPIVMSLLYSAAPPNRAGEAVGLRTTVLNFVQTTIPLAFGALGSALGVTPIFWAMAIVMAAGTAFARRRRP
ncbi:MAG TPA: MFS transporter [Burkholderiales bacterium]|nr:MFS transporter [Burkholderiales bacterium]